jgi:phenylalanyl-tRNA synthetase beta chain
VALANPLSEKFAVMRPSILPGLLDALVYNRRREVESVRLFEIGGIFFPSGERTAAGWMLTGPRVESWHEPGRPADFYDALGIASLVADAFGVRPEARPAGDLPWAVPGRAARLVVPDGSRAIGEVGEVRPALVDARGLSRAGIVAAGWIDLGALPVVEGIRALAPLPRHPSVVRDISIVVDERLPAAEVRGTIRAHAPATLVALREFDRYQGRGVPDGRVSLSIRLTFRAADRTLTDAEVQATIDAVVAALGREHGAVLRGSSA